MAPLKFPKRAPSGNAQEKLYARNFWADFSFPDSGRVVEKHEEIGFWKASKLLGCLE